MCQKLSPPFPSQKMNLIQIRILRKAWKFRCDRSGFCLRMMILGRHCLETTRCRCRSSLVTPAISSRGTEKKIGQNSQFIAF